MRALGYAAAGAVAAASVGALGALARLSPALQPLWVMFQALVLALGLWLLWQGRQPAWLGSLGRTPAAGLAPAGASMVVAAPLSARARRRWWPAAAAGGLWFAWPCGLLQSALLVASLAGGAEAGALAMLAFALTSAAGLSLAPWVLKRLVPVARRQQMDALLVRTAGLLLVLGSVFALGHGIWGRLAAFCGLD
jgi:uncharacterized protein